MGEPPMVYDKGWYLSLREVNVEKQDDRGRFYHKGDDITTFRRWYSFAVGFSNGQTSDLAQFLTQALFRNMIF